LSKVLLTLRNTGEKQKKLINSIKKDFNTMALVLIPVAIAINIVDRIDYCAAETTGLAGFNTGFHRSLA
jgi:hypothetical protein